MKKTTTLIVMAMLCLIFNTDAQNLKSTIKPLKVGDRVPEEIWNRTFQVVNHPQGKETMTLKEFKGKLIILDFWGTHCGSCISAMPRTNKLEKQFSDQMVIIGVTDENREKVSSFIPKNKTLKSINPFSIIGENVIQGFFPTNSIPHYVWIGEEGLIEAITNPDQITEEHIIQVLKKAPLTVEPKEYIDTDRPIFAGEGLQQHQLFHYSVMVKGRQNGLSSGSEAKSFTESMCRRVFTNYDIKGMYHIVAWELFQQLGLGKFSMKRLIIESAYHDLLEDTVSKHRPDWYRNNLYTYDKIIPISESPNLYHYILEDLNHYLNFTGTIEKRKVKCMVLVKRKKNKEVKGSLAPNSFPLHNYAGGLNSKEFIKPQVLNETGIKDEINLIKSESKNMKELLEELHALNLDLKEAFRTIDVFVIRDKKPTQLSSFSNK
ncbi:TlpA family protein disulfide reductase [Pedobacter caeni]|uniref:Thiol-disulfide isomerase or thioredoxin n=1 Tax=Pedobacter caeni TaxID=288992 RepID=A0A1M5PNR9_9SPHI|nr:TlpA disulfide reductase family protein [Pedobacter caeni]SHH03402.1 Thiol-disulfide isomerase or thioredoxin [Pedobacter caeni]